MNCFRALLVLLTVTACGGTDGGVDDGGSATDSARPPDGAMLVDGAAEDSSVAPDGALACFAWGTSCGAVVDPVCCEGICGPSLRWCCSEPDGRCEVGTSIVNDGCCAGATCNATTGLCEVRTCFPSHVPGSGGPSCMAAGETAPCCDAGYACTEDPIYEPWCCAPAELIIDASRMGECCSGNVELLGGGRVRCLAD